MARTRFMEGDGSIDRARELRRESTPAEDALWAIVRDRGVGDAKFRRQQRFGPFYADLICQGAKLVIEIHGDTHAHSPEADARRTAFFEQEGYRLIRFTNADVLTNLEGVHHAIIVALRPSPSHSAAPSGPLPLPRGERRE